jgi:hypothetical protein
MSSSGIGFRHGIEDKLANLCVRTQKILWLAFDTVFGGIILNLISLLQKEGLFEEYRGGTAPNHGYHPVLQAHATTRFDQG